MIGIAANVVKIRRLLFVVLPKCLLLIVLSICGDDSIDWMILHFFFLAAATGQAQLGRHGLRDPDATLALDGLRGPSRLLLQPFNLFGNVWVVDELEVVGADDEREVEVNERASNEDD